MNLMDGRKINLSPPSSTETITIEQVQVMLRQLMQFLNEQCEEKRTS